MNGAFRVIMDSLYVVAALLVDRGNEIGKNRPFVERGFGGVVAVQEVL